MNGHRKSDDPIVPKKPANNDARASAEQVEERGSAKGNRVRQNKGRTQRRILSLENATDRIRQAARRDKKQKFTSLWHHVYDERRLRAAFNDLKRNAAVGVDGVSWREYASTLDARLADLSARLRRGGYRPQPVRRVFIPKPDGRQRPLGIPAIEDKIVQRASVEVLNAIYETDFMGFSYGFRPGRHQHMALDALSVGIERRRVNYVLDADIRGFFDAIDHEWLIRFIQHRISDERVVRHVKKWLHAGVLEDGKIERQETGTPQGGIISPLLANVYLHYAFDLWAHAWRQRCAQGDVTIVRYADDFVVGFERRDEAERFQSDLVERFRKFGLELHPDKTRLIEFGRYAARNRKARGEGKPDSFTFLGFRHICVKDPRGWFAIDRKTDPRKLTKKLQELKVKLRRLRHAPVRAVGLWLRSVLIGHYHYYSVPGNRQALDAFRWALTRLWKQTLSRRSQKGAVTWSKMKRLARYFLPTPKFVHPPPYKRLVVTTQGRSPVR